MATNGSAQTKEVQENCLRPDPQLQKIIQAFLVLCAFSLEENPAHPSQGNGRSQRHNGLDGKGKLLQEFRARPGDDHISSVEDDLHLWRGRNGCAKEVAWIAYVLTPVCVDEGTGSSSQQDLELCQCSVSRTVPGHSLKLCPAVVCAVQLGPFSPSPSCPLPPNMVPRCG